jgi:hypothetical protein
MIVQEFGTTRFEHKEIRARSSVELQTGQTQDHLWNTNTGKKRAI